MSLATSFTRLLGIRTPVVLAPMAGVSAGLLASQVSSAGGFGLMSPIPGAPLDSWKEQLSIARSNVSTTPSGKLNVGAGFLGWVLDKQSDGVVNNNNNEFLQEALDQGVRAVWFSFGDDLKKWIDVVRAHDRHNGNDSGSEEDNKTLVFVLVNSVEDALVAVEEWEVDVLAVQGFEAGGHGSATTPPLFTLLPSVLSALGTSTSRSSGLARAVPPILAAGGLTTPSQLSAALTLGASGCVLGTIFLPCPSSLYPPSKKAAILAAKSTQIGETGALTQRSMWFDWLMDGTEWPKGVDGRALRMKVVDELDELKGLRPGEVVESAIGKEEDERRKIEGVKEKWKGLKGKEKEEIVWAGMGAALVNESREAKEIVEEMHEGIVKTLKTASTIVADA